MDALAIVRRRLGNEGLVGDGFASPAEAVAGLVAVQAQEYAEAKWSLGQRVRASVDADVERAVERGDILRTHVLRPTWHFVTPADIRWLLRLTGPRVQAANRYWYGQLGLDEATLAAGKDVLARTLDDGQPRTRPELAAALAAAGIEAAGPRLAYVCMNAELTELVCSGPRRGAQQTYALLDHRAPAGGALDDLTPEEARAELVRRWFTSHGPATVRDLAAWASLTVADIRTGLAQVGDQLHREDDEAGRAWYSRPEPSTDGFQPRRPHPPPAVRRC